MQDPDGGAVAPAVSLSPAVAEALLILDTRYMRATRDERGDISVTRDVSIGTLERIDRARDELLRHPNRAGDPEQLVSNAWGNAGKVIRDRITLLSGPRDGEEDEVSARKRALRIAELRERYGSRDEDDLGVSLELEVLDVVAHASISSRDRQLVELLMVGVESDEIAERYGVSRSVAQVRASRARRRVQMAWLAA